MTTRGPGGRIPNQGNPPAAAGVGKNSKRHDLERQATPGLADSDLQQGDVQALEQGQRVAPITTQPDAAPAPTQAVGGGSQPVAEGAPDLNSIIEGRLGGTMDATAPGFSNLVDEAASQRASQWLGFLSGIANQPFSSPILRARVQTMMAANMNNAPRKAAGGVMRLAEVDEALEAAFGDEEV